MGLVSRKVHYMHIDNMLGTASPEWWSLRPDMNSGPRVKKHQLRERCQKEGLLISDSPDMVLMFPPVLEDIFTAANHRRQTVEWGSYGF